MTAVKCQPTRHSTGEYIRLLRSTYMYPNTAVLLLVSYWACRLPPRDLSNNKHEHQACSPALPCLLPRNRAVRVRSTASGPRQDLKDSANRSMSQLPGRLWRAYADIHSFVAKRKILQHGGPRLHA